MPAIIPSTQTPQTYTISEPSKDYVVPAFTVIPSQCASRVVYSFNPATDSSPVIQGNQGYGASFNSATATFSFFYTGSADLAGIPATPLGKVYYLLVTGSLPSVSQQAALPLTVYNPCLDETKISLTAPALPTFTYTIGDSVNNFWDHDPFTVNAASPEIEALCGGLSYIGSNSPSLYGGFFDAYMAYASSLNRFFITIYDPNFLQFSPQIYKVKAYLTAYPSVVAEASGSIVLSDPCEDPAFLMAMPPASTTFVSDYSQSVIFQFPTLIVSPASCLPYRAFTCELTSYPAGYSGDDLC